MNQNWKYSWNFGSNYTVIYTSGLPLAYVFQI